MSVGSAAVLGFSHDIGRRFLAFATGLAMLMRARLFRYTSQVVLPPRRAASPPSGCWASASPSTRRPDYLTTRFR